MSEFSRFSFVFQIYFSPRTAAAAAATGGIYILVNCDLRDVNIYNPFFLFFFFFSSCQAHVTASLFQNLSYFFSVIRNSAEHL